MRAPFYFGIILFCMVLMRLLAIMFSVVMNECSDECRTQV